jgi:site-specific recombinase XerD
MDQSSRTVSQNLPLERLVAKALGEIECLGYSRRSRNRYRAVWTHFVEFSRRNKGADEFSGKLAARFLQEYGADNEESDKPGEGWRRHITFSVRVLAEFAHHGRIERRVTDLEKIHLHPAMEKVLRDFEQYSKDRLQLRPSTLRRRTRELTIFLDFLDSIKSRTLAEIQALDLSGFLSWRARYLKPVTMSRIVSEVRCFLRFLTLRGILPKDLSLELPTIRVPRDASIPSVWDRDLVVKLLGAVDRSSAKGKRDYAILLLACRLGLRAGDIRRLKLDHLHWEDCRIEILQSKTATPLSLPLSEEVGDALIDYLRWGRPETAHREVFLKLNHPFDPFLKGNNLYHIVTYWRRLAGIKFRVSHKRGLHSLRHTLATRLLEQGTPFPTIADVLGHTTLESTRIYAKADVEALRSVALDPEEVNHGE